MGPEGPRGPMGEGGVGGVGGGARGERAIPQKQGNHIQVATATRSLKTGGHKTVQGRRGAGEAVLNSHMFGVIFPYVRG